MRRKITAVKAFLVALATISILLPVPAYSSNNGDCPFGQKYIEGDYDSATDEFSFSCEPMMWEFESVNDGFTNRITLTMDEDLYGLPGGTDIYELTLIARCENKKLEAFFASSYILFSNQNRVYSKLLQYRLDNGKIIKSSFSEATSDKAFFVTSPKTLLASIAKAKNKLNIKFATSKGTGLSQFPVADFAKYRVKFANAGCKF